MSPASGSPASRLGPRSLAFLRRLRRNNRREWFEHNRAVYERDLREPLRALVEEVDVRLAGFAAEIVGDPRRSMFRIHRDIRFSRDKSPYKTNAGLWFFHRDAGKQVGTEAESGGAGFYFHVAPDGCFSAGGIWMPARPALNRLRQAIADNPGALLRILRAPAFRRRFGGLDTEAMLKRMPRGFDESHPAASLLRHQSFTVSRPLADTTVTGPRLVGVLARDFRALLPLVRWLNRSLGYLPATTRLGPR